MVSLDGSNRIIATEFIKLEITGTSNLATAQYVNTAIINGGGGGGGGADLTNYYQKSEVDTLLNNKYNKSETDILLNNKYDKSETDTLLNNKYDKSETDTLLNNKYNKSETDTLLNNKYNKSETDTLLDNKLNISNPQDMTGTLRIGHILGTSKIILNAVSSDKDFYVNGDAQIGGNHLVASLDSSGYIKGSNIQSNIFNTLNTNDILFQSNNDTYIQYDVSEAKIVASKLIQCGGNLKTQEIDTIAPLDLILKRNAVSMVELQDNLTVLNTKTECVNNILCDYIESRNTSTIMSYVMNESTGEIKFYVGSPTVPDATTNLVMTLQNNLITFHKPTSPEIGAGGGVDDTNLVKYTGEALQTIEGDVVIGGGAQFSNYDFTVNGSAYFSSFIELPLSGSLNLGNNKGYIRSINLGGGNHAYDYANFSSGGYHRFYVGGSPFPQFLRFQLSSTQAYFNVETICPELQTDIINTKDAGNNDLVFKRNDIEYMKFEGTQQAVEITKGAKSNTYDSIGNADVSFRRNTVDFLYLRNGNVETNTGIELYSQSAKFDTIDTTSNTDMVFNRNGTEFFKLGTGYETTNGAPTNLLNVDSSAGVSAGWMFANAFANRSNDTNTEFRGAISGGSGWGKIYMLYEHIPENLNFYTDLHLNQSQKMYLHKETGKSSYIYSENVAGVNHLKIYSEDPNGDIRFYAGGSVRLFVTPSKVSVPAPYTLEGDLVDTSSEKVKYDIKEAEYDFTSIVKNIKLKTFKLNKEKEADIYKNHIGFVAENVEDNVPTEIQNIVYEVDGIKSLNYVKLNTLLWGCVQQQQSKIEHLEATMFEMMEEIKELKGKKKPKAKAKSKDKDED